MTTERGKLTNTEVRLAEQYVSVLDFVSRSAQAIDHGDWFYLYDKASELEEVAGLLVTVYGQHLSRLVALRAGDLTRQGDVVFLSRGGYALELPDPLGSWAWTLRTARAPTSVQPAGDPDTRWLVPGRLPGRPLRPASLGARLRRYGITARAARNDALTDIAAAVAPLTVASLLDMHPNTANAWAEASSGSWSRYLDDLLDDQDDTDHTWEDNR